jgi:Cdc6-like AAA superfamily ATPase
MGILDKIKTETPNKTTKGFYFGHTEAEGENKSGIQNLDNYFEDYLEVLPQIENEKFIFIGRKGSGKSAIAKFINDSCLKTDDSYADIIKFNDIELEKIIQVIPTSDQSNIELLIFEWLILVRLIRLFINNKEAKYILQYKKFKDFIDRNAGFAEIDKYHINEIIEKKKLQISIEVLKHVFGPTIAKYIDTKSTKAPFYQFVNPLKEIILEVINFDIYKDKEFYILFDDLDITFQADNDEAKEKLLALLRAAKNLNTSIFKGTKTRVLVFLRNDIKKVLEPKDSDTSKMFSSYDISLDWYDHQNFRLNENQVALKRFANKRIGLNFKSNNIPYDEDNPWGNLFQDDDITYGMKSSFKYFIDFTFYRPRDIVLFLSEVGKNSYDYPLSSRCFKVLINKFIQSNVKELKSEFRIHFSEDEITILFGALKQLCNIGNTITKEEALRVFDLKLPGYDCHKILEYMLDYSILILKGQDDRLYFNYRDNNLETVDFDNLNMTLHKSIFKYFYPDRIC